MIQNFKKERKLGDIMQHSSVVKWFFFNECFFLFTEAKTNTDSHENEFILESLSGQEG